MDIFRNQFDAMRTSYRLTFQKAFDAAPTLYQEFCMVDGDAAHTVLELPFLGAFTFMREWIGDRQIKNLAGRKLRLVERPFEDTIAIPRRDIETDNWGQYAHAVAQLGQSGAQLWDRLAIEALTGAPNWIDDEAFFSETRKYGNSTICNRSSAALSAASLESAYDLMSSYCGHNGEPLGVRPTVLIVGPSLRGSARKLLENQFMVEDGASVDNPTRDLVEYRVSPRLVGDYADDWYLVATSGVPKPILLMKSKEASLTSLSEPTDQNVFLGNRALFGVDAYGNAAAAFPHLVYRGGR